MTRPVFPRSDSSISADDGDAFRFCIRYRTLADGDFNHTSALVLLDADGRVVARTERIGFAPDPAFLAAMRNTLRSSREPAPQD